MNLAAALLVLGAYLLGAVPFGLVVARLLGGPDPRSGGSGNIGATNVSRLAGRGAGVATLLLDAGKGALPTALALHWLSPAWAAAAGLAAFLGHIFPIYLGFKGGKGVATFLGVLAVVAPLALLCTLAALGLGAGLTGRMSVGSLAGCLSAPLWLWLLSCPRPLIYMALLMAPLVVWSHRQNILRLLAGQEPRW